MRNCELREKHFNRRQGGTASAGANRRTRLDTAIEAVGIPATFTLCEDIVAAGGTIANVGVHGVKVDLHLERLWSHNVTITTGLVDTLSIPMLLKTVQSKRIDAAQMVTHRFTLGEILQAYETFGNAADAKALKVIIEI